MKAIFVLVLLAPLGIETISAEEVRTYRIVDTGEAAFRYGGGLLDFNLTATLRGTFDVTIADDKTATFSRFDVSLHDVVNTGTYDLGWTEGDSLATRLLQPINGVWGGLVVDNGSDLLLFSQTSAASGTAHLAMTGRIAHLNATTAVFNLGFSYININVGDGMGVPWRPVPDVPSMSIGRAGSDLVVTLVPEPSSMMLAMAIAVVLLKRR